MQVRKMQAGPLIGIVVRAFDIETVAHETGGMRK